MAHTVIAVYRPHAGKGEALLELVKTHLPTLREQGLATDTPSVVLRASDGSLLEIFDWISGEAVEAAHTNEAVQAMWEDFAAVCDFATLDSLAEAEKVFAHFERVTL
jgi:quinol monooxygenase YgiN